jgi:hypothetical protein
VSEFNAFVIFLERRMKRFRVKVVEKHSDYVWVDAVTAEEAEDKAHELAECEYESLYSAEATGETEEI